MASKYSDIFLARIDEIEKCLDMECYIAALSLVLTLPDICGLAEYNIKNVGKRYMQWYDQYIGKYEKPNSPYGEDMPYLSGEVVYNLRNSFLHSGNPGIEKGKIIEDNCKIDHFKLIISESLLGDESCVRYCAGNEIRERKYEVNVRMLCMKLYRTAKTYYQENKEKFNFFHYEISDQ